MKILSSVLILVLIGMQLACSTFVTQTESRQVAHFSSLDVSGLAQVFITQADEQNIQVKVSGMPITDVITKVDNGVLIITTRGFHRGESVQVFVDYNQLNSIKTSGSAEITGTNLLNTDRLMITTKGAGDIKKLAIKADSLMVSINGAGNAKLDIDVENFDVLMNDAGDLSVEGRARYQNVRSNRSRGTLDNADLAY